jgi:hypothetical protein
MKKWGSANSSLLSTGTPNSGVVAIRDSNLQYCYFPEKALPFPCVY